MSGEDDEFVKDCMSGLSKNGSYTVNKTVYEKIRGVFEGGFCDDEKTKETIGSVFKEKNYLCDTHTAVALGVYFDYKEKSGDLTPSVIASTASPFKFSPAVLQAVDFDAELDEDGFKLMETLSEKTGVAVPSPLAAIRQKPVRFTKSVECDEMTGVVLEMLGIE